ncbi:MAG: mercuric transport protein periplasmic component [Betaproteobacteria bacterium RIFCSPLOWO2_12_FULL_63_13]|nr:MAG: mercuric transport protein periplasmic component [Betaproteobacteria bacterium RIFCSPLOWO2_12_FULL_63_13]
MKKLAIGVALTAAAFSVPVWAISKTVTLSIPSMYCEVCPITVKKALTKVDGVAKVEVNFSKRQATVTYDDAKASVETLTRATANAGYPSTLER